MTSTNRSITPADALGILGAGLNVLREAGLVYRIGNRDDGRALLIVIDGARLTDAGAIEPVGGAP